jgi:hypothetical protein
VYVVGPLDYWTSGLGQVILLERSGLFLFVLWRLLLKRAEGCRQRVGNCLIVCHHHERGMLMDNSVEDRSQEGMKGGKCFYGVFYRLEEGLWRTVEGVLEEWRF